MKLIFEKSSVGRNSFELPKSDIADYKLSDKLTRSTKIGLPDVSEIDFVRHYTELSRNAYGVDNLFYPLGSCTMKYNPKLNEIIAGNKQFSDVHPLQGDAYSQGSLEMIYELTSALSEITGMSEATLQPAAGAQGEYTSLLIVRAYHHSRGDAKRNKILVPDSAHGTNPASAAMAGFEIINVPSDKHGSVDLKALSELVGDDTAALMLTNPNTLGVMDAHIKRIASIVHKAGGLMYYDGANLNAVMGVYRPGDMGFDLTHLNLHKTFSTPHGGGGPGCGAIAVKSKLARFLPKPVVVKKRGKYFLDYNRPDSIGKVKSYYGNFLVALRAYAYIKTLGAEGIKDAAQKAVLNANYLYARIKDYYPLGYKAQPMHEFVLSCDKLKHETGVSAMDVAKCFIDYKMHPPTMYFPLIVHEALMFEPTETETKDTLDAAADALIEIYKKAHADPEYVKAAPHYTVISRPDDTLAARKPVLIYKDKA